MKTEQGTVAASIILLVVASLARAESPPVPNLRLGNEARPLAYSAELVVLPEVTNFTGQIVTWFLRIAPRSFGCMGMG